MRNLRECDVTRSVARGEAELTTHLQGFGNGPGRFARFRELVETRRGICSIRAPLTWMRRQT